MKNYKYILFDLDGTITDSSEGIINSVTYALSKLDIQVSDKSVLYNFIGPPLSDSFRTYFNLNEEQIKTAISYFRDNYKDKGIFQNRIYDGISEVFEYLTKHGKKLMLATSKPEIFAERILVHSNIRKYFDFISGATADEKRVKKEDVIEYLLSHFRDTNTSDYLMVGDTKYDVIGAHHFGIDALGVLYGFGSRKDLENVGAEYIVEKPEDLKIIAEG